MLEALGGVREGRRCCPQSPLHTTTDDGFTRLRWPMCQRVLENLWKGKPGNRRRAPQTELLACRNCRLGSQMKTHQREQCQGSIPCLWYRSTAQSLSLSLPGLVPFVQCMLPQHTGHRNGAKPTTEKRNVVGGTTMHCRLVLPLLFLSVLACGTRVHQPALWP